MSETSLSPYAPYVLGIDLGAQSVGWALLRWHDGGPSGLEALGSRVFEAGVTGTAGDIETGKDESRAVARRDARLQRRQTFRRAQRRRRLLRLLIETGLLPPGKIEPRAEVHEYFQEFDKGLRERHLGPGKPQKRVEHHIFFYRLRAKSLDEQLPLHDFGRVLYQLGQRRGFKSNRRAGGKKDEDQGQVKSAIHELAAKMEETGARTLGEYLASLDPEEERIRRRWTRRNMYEEELQQIWESQAKFHPELTPELYQRVFKAMFDQRPLRSQKHLVGECPLIRHRKRCPQAARSAQRFRLLQKLNDLCVTEPREIERSLTTEERDTVLSALLGQGDHLDKRGDLSFAKLRTLLGLPKGTRFNLERGEEKKIAGHRTDHKLRPLFGPRWDQMPEEEKDGIVDALAGIEDPKHVERIARERWGLAAEAAATLAETTFEPGYAAFSRAAMRRLTARMEDGTSFATARKELFPESFTAAKPLDRLPVVAHHLRQLRNPAVHRALVEMRKVVNAVIRRWGVPEQIRLEMARELKMPRERRQRYAKTIREREQERRSAEEEICRITGRDRANRREIEKYLLWKECGYTCPYTGMSISPNDLFGEAPQFDIEHIWPFPRSLDDSFLNKTLCHVKENRDRKGNKTPYEAYAADPERWERICKRVQDFQGPVREEKLRRFRAEAIPEVFSSRHLNDTRYAARLAANLLGTLYGGEVDAQGTRRVRVSAGGVTAFLRNELDLNRVLGDGGEKVRGDHRHHAVDAVAIGLTNNAMVQALADAAERAPAERRRRFGRIPEPWPGFLGEVRQEVELLHVSHRVSRRVSGALHEESYHSPPIPTPQGDVHRKRVALEKISSGQVKNIADPTVRALVEAQLDELGATNPSRAFSVEANLPVFALPDGRVVKIKAVRVDVPQKALKIGKPGHERYVLSDSNHHMAVVAVLDAEGNPKSWEGHIVPLFEAMRRLRAGEPVVRCEWGEGRRFECSLAPGECFQLPNSDGAWELFRVRTLYGSNPTSTNIECVSAQDARQKKDIRSAKDWHKESLNKLMRKGLRKVSVNPLGQIFPSHD